MSAMTLRNLPTNVVETLRRRARSQQRSLNSLICELLTREASEDERRERMRAQRPRAEALRRSIARRHGEGTPAERLIRQDRRR